MNNYRARKHILVCTIDLSNPILNGLQELSFPLRSFGSDKCLTSMQVSRLAREHADENTKRVKPDQRVARKVVVETERNKSSHLTPDFGIFSPLA